VLLDYALDARAHGPRGVLVLPAHYAVNRGEVRGHFFRNAPEALTRRDA